MSALTYGELFAGYDGLGMGIRSVLGGETRWYAEFDAAPSKILAHHHPSLPNLGDVTIDIIRPRLVVWENVRGALSAAADSSVEPCPFCVGDGGRVSLRALGRVLGDLAELGYDARWYGLRAADVGAAHGRFRVFLFATPRDASGVGVEGLWASRVGVSPAHAGQGVSLRSGADADGGLTLLGTPRCADGMAHNLREEVGNPRGRLEDQVSLLPTPMVGSTSPAAHGQISGQYRAAMDEAFQNWREYEAAIRRQEYAFGRPAPLPTEPGAKGQPRLSPRFVEWLMGLPEGHVTDPAIGISRNDQLKALGNGVVPQQAAAAARAFLHDTQAAS